KICCEIDGHYTCCDSDEEIPEGRRSVYAGTEINNGFDYFNNSIVQMGIFDCNYLTCKGKCCKDYCCPFSNGKCCQDRKCCPSGTGCCPLNCCPTGQDCCGGGCCAYGQRCCGSWCCKKKQSCGVSPYTCYGAGVIFTPAITTVLFLVASAVTSKTYFH
ncbi:hypothetical protein NPIL_146171, partial [Nephila pilipes]